MLGRGVITTVVQVEKNKYFLVNLNADPSLNELLVYYLKERSLVGREDAALPQDIQLSGTLFAYRYLFKIGTVPSLYSELSATGTLF